MKFSVSAPGKIILFGEHSVVYGKSAIAAAIDKRTKITLEELSNKNEKDKIYLDLVSFDYKKELSLETVTNKQKETVPIHRREILILATPEAIDHTKFMDLVNNDVNELNDTLHLTQLSTLTAIFYLLRGMFYASKTIIKPVKITVTSDLTVGAGTGSSASIAVCLAATFYNYIVHGKINKPGRLPFERNEFCEQDLMVINKWAFSLERLFHGNPSGLDNYVSTFGSLVHISFNSETQQKVIGMVDNTRILRVLLIYSGVPRCTMKMVKSVSELHERNHSILENIFTAMDGVANEAICVIEKIGTLQNENASDITSFNDEIMHLEDLIDINQGLLVSLKVSHRTLNEIIEITASYKLHAKMTGAGGGGYVYALIPPWITQESINDCIHYLKGKGYTATEIKLGGPGVLLHT